MEIAAETDFTGLVRIFIAREFKPVISMKCRKNRIMIVAV